VPWVMTGHWIPDKEGSGKWHTQRIRSGLLSKEIPLLILSTILFSRWKQSVPSVTKSTFMLALFYFTAYVRILSNFAKDL